MIDRYTIKFGPAVSQKELEKALHENIDSEQLPIHKMKARIEIICDFEDLKKLKEMVEALKQPPK